MCEGIVTSGLFSFFVSFPFSFLFLFLFLFPFSFFFLFLFLFSFSFFFNLFSTSRFYKKEGKGVFQFICGKTWQWKVRGFGAPGK